MFRASLFVGALNKYKTDLQYQTMPKSRLDFFIDTNPFLFLASDTSDLMLSGNYSVVRVFSKYNRILLFCNPDPDFIVLY